MRRDVLCPLLLIAKLINHLSTHAKEEKEAGGGEREAGGGEREAGGGGRRAGDKVCIIEDVQLSGS